MEEDRKPGQVIFTNKARCRDCNRCVRVCPVKAIRITGGQAYVEHERCIGCGTCVRECPQGAKSYRNDVGRAARLAGEGFAAVSLAPSFPAEFERWEWKRLPSALRRLGFSSVSETAVGAYRVSLKMKELVERDPGRSWVCTACPAVVGYVEKYRPADLESLLGVVSPMIAHARLLRARYGRAIKVVFVGPCVTKKLEAERPEHAGLVDCVLSFSELRQWLTEREIDLSECEESGFDEVPGGEARLYPLEGGSLRTAALGTDALAAGTVMVSGFEEVNEALGSLTGAAGPRVIEPLFCPQGCINGPGSTAGANLFVRRTEVLAYAAQMRASQAATTESPAKSAEPARLDGLETTFTARPVNRQGDISEEQILAVLAGTGQSGPEDELNCGACGYGTCSERAVAVIRGLAEPEMCIPYMRRLAERRTDKIIETSPNGIVILDERLEILSMNPAFKRYFTCSEATCGRHIGVLMDPEPFERLLSGETEKIELVAEHKRYNIICHQILYKLLPDGQYVGIFVNITNNRENREKLERLRQNTMNQARELLDHQVNVAREMSSFLGESTARGEALVQKLIELTAEQDGKSAARREFNPWPTNTAK